jgi:hypothetical protein
MFHRARIFMMVDLPVRFAPTGPTRSRGLISILKQKFCQTVFRQQQVESS